MDHPTSSSSLLEYTQVRSVIKKIFAPTGLSCHKHLFIWNSKIDFRINEMKWETIFDTELLFLQGLPFNTRLWCDHCFHDAVKLYRLWRGCTSGFERTSFKNSWKRNDRIPFKGSHWWTTGHCDHMAQSNLLHYAHVNLLILL